MFFSKISPCEASSYKVSGLRVLNDFWKSLKHFKNVLHAYLKQTDFGPKEILKYRQRSTSSIPSSKEQQSFLHTEMFLLYALPKGLAVEYVMLSLKGFIGKV